MCVDDDASRVIEEQGYTTSTRPISVRWEAWALLAAAAGAVAAGTWARGFAGVEEWVFNTDNLADSTTLALPFLVAAGVVIGAGRWPAAGSSLLVGAALLALSGAMQAASDFLFAWLADDRIGFDEFQSWLSVTGIVELASSAAAFGALAIGLWRSAPETWTGSRRITAVGVGVATLVAATGLLVTFVTSLGRPGVTTIDVWGYLSVGLIFAGIVAIGALAVAAVRAVPKRSPLPEVLIASGATVLAVWNGGTMWLGALGEVGVAILTYAPPLSIIAMLVLAAGFASGALFWPAED
jgi:hypothetical protein